LLNIFALIVKSAFNDRRIQRHVERNLNIRIWRRLHSIYHAYLI